MNMKIQMMVLSLFVTLTSMSSFAAISKEMVFKAKVKNIESSSVDVAQNGRVFKVPKSLLKKATLKPGQNIALHLTTKEFHKIKEVPLKLKIARIPRKTKAL